MAQHMRRSGAEKGIVLHITSCSSLLQGAACGPGYSCKAVHDGCLIETAANIIMISASVQPCMLPDLTCFRRPALLQLFHANGEVYSA
jgi:hypothetical protein